MKKSSLVLVLALLLLTTTPTLAVNGAIPTLRQELKDKRLEIKKEIEVKREGVKDKNLELKKSKAQATVKRLRQGIVNRYENILKHKASVVARIAKIEAANNATPTPKKIRDLTAAKTKLATFDTSKYVIDLASFDAKVTEVLASSTPLKLTPELKTIAKSLDTDLKTMRSTLADTLRLIIKAR